VGYTGVEYRDINAALRDGTWRDDPKIREAVENIDSAMAQFSLKHDIVVYRGDKAKYYEDWKIDGVYPADAFFSTTATKERTFFKTEGVVIEVNVPRDTPGIYVGQNSANNTEDEFLLKHGLKYRVLEKGEGTLKLEVVR
jgi:hypothetical protein